VLVEDAAELRPDHPHVVSLEARPPNVEGAGTLRDLVRQALHMRPDRLVVAEVRGAEDPRSSVTHLGRGVRHRTCDPSAPRARIAATSAFGGIERSWQWIDSCVNNGGKTRLGESGKVAADADGMGS
jgi:pilus assembly protein CpaF